MYYHTRCDDTVEGCGHLLCSSLHTVCECYGSVMEKKKKIFHPIVSDAEPMLSLHIHFLSSSLQVERECNNTTIEKKTEIKSWLSKKKKKKQKSCVTYLRSSFSAETQDFQDDVTHTVSVPDYLTLGIAAAGYFSAASRGRQVRVFIFIVRRGRSDCNKNWAPRNSVSF